MNQHTIKKIYFEQVSSESQLALVEEMAGEIWREHYTPIIGSDQVSYMLDKFQSVPAMKEQMGQGYEYYVINKENQRVGYLSFVKKADALFLSKVYVLKSFRRKGIGLAAMHFVERSALERNCSKVSLTVNKNNRNSIRAYKKAGYRNTESIVMDIGEGYVMDDYKFEKEIVI